MDKQASAEVGAVAGMLFISIKRGEMLLIKIVSLEMQKISGFLVF